MKESQNTTVINSEKLESNTGTNAEKKDNSNSFEEHNIKLEGTPFVRRKTDKGWIVTMGNHRITEPTKTEKQAEDLIYKLNWLTLIRVIATAVENVLDEKQKIAKEELRKQFEKLNERGGKIEEEIN